MAHVKLYEINFSHEIKKKKKDNPLLEIYLPYKIPSTHTICRPIKNKNDSLWYMEDSYMDIDAQIKQALNCYYNGDHHEAYRIFQNFVDSSVVAKYFISLILYDGLCGDKNSHEKAVILLKDVFESNLRKYDKLKCCVQYNIGRAHYEGLGVKQSDNEAERLWLQAAQNGDQRGCIKAQSVLAMFYSRKRDDKFNLEKAYHWHQEASVNGNLDSSTALAIMYEYGLGVEKSNERAFKYFKMAAKKGNVFAMGNLSLFYYRYKMYTNAFRVAKKISALGNSELISRQTDCLVEYVKKGIALGCFVYARCLSKGIGDEIDTSAVWYSKAAEYDLDMLHKMQVLVVQGTM